MKLLKIEKGTYRYIDRKKLLEIIKTVFMYCCALGLYLIGYFTLKTNKSAWTIFAVLSVLPASKNAVNMIMFLRFKSVDKSEYDIIEAAKGIVPVKYDYIFTTSETSYCIKSAACRDNTVIALLDTKRTGKKTSVDNAANALKSHLKASIERENLKGYSIKIFTDTEGYIERLKQMNNKPENSDDKSALYVFSLFNSITL